MNMEKTTERYPIRYYSIITVANSLMKKAGWKRKRSFMKTAGTCTG